MAATSALPPPCVELDPSDSIVFVLHPASSPSATLTIRNVSLSRHIAFTVKTTTPTRYLVKPPNGVLAPNASLSVTLVLQPQECDQLRQCLPEKQDKFLVQITSSDPLDAPLPVTSFKLVCEFQVPGEAPPPLLGSVLLPPLAPPPPPSQSSLPSLPSPDKPTTLRPSSSPTATSSPRGRSRSKSKDSGSARHITQLQSARQSDEQKRDTLFAYRDRDPTNLKCFNCLPADTTKTMTPVYICLDFGTFVCDLCSGIHRQCEHRVKSISMSKFTDEEVETMLKCGGNAAAKLKWRKTYLASCTIPGASPEERARNAVRLTFVERAWTGEKPPPSLPAIPPPSASPARRNRSGSTGAKTKGGGSTASASSQQQLPPSAKKVAKPVSTLWDKLVPTLCKSWPWLQGLPINPLWAGDYVVDASSPPGNVEIQLREKLAFVRTSLAMPGEPSGGPFGGIHLLRGLASSSESSGSSFLEADLLYALEVLDLRATGAYEALDKIESYAMAVGKANTQAHPLLLLALTRCAVKMAGSTTGSSTTASSSASKSLVQCFHAMYPTASAKWTTSSEKSLLTSALPLGAGAGVGASPQSAATGSPSSSSTGVRLEWEQLQRASGCASQAMEELLNMVGLDRVKRTALQLFKNALALHQMSAELQQKNRNMALNYCFTGNPGTGKTTVAKLFASILVDSKMRRQPKMEICSAQQLKDDGPQAFRAKIQQSLGGVLFIDEAYELEPQQDPRGKPIVAELLVAAEDLRGDLSVILAGYEDDIQNKLYAYNTGLRSRFIEVPFDDFDEKDLLFVWTKLVTERGWVCDGSQVGVIACRRLAKAAGRKGFGNARAVRQLFESAVQAAMARPNFVGATPTIQLIDIVGERPTKNQKLADVLSEVDHKIGWTRIKERVHELVDLCDTNYERELGSSGSSSSGGSVAAAIPVMLHRLFLGNPGTGKTTFASFYGRVLKHLHLLSNGDVVKKTAGDFVGDHVGQSQAKTNEILQNAKGKVLIIDEAYNLNDNLYGKQVLDVLVEKIQGSSEGDDIAVVMIGYEPQMAEMMRVQNPGLARRFPLEFAFYFDDYSDRELLSIFSSACAKQHVQSSMEVDEAVVAALAKQRRLANFGNAGAVEQLLKNAMANATVRHRRVSTKAQNNSQYIQLIGDDISSEMARRSDLPHASKRDPLSLLDGLYRMDSIRKELSRLQKRLRIAQAQGESQPPVGHFVFRGSPGTGKTTVARVMGKILYAMGVLSTDKVVETSGLSMTGEYVGATKKKVETQLDEARGAILFIDEAYEMGKGAYGEEALTTLVAAMTNPVYKGTVVVIAGYPQDLDIMLGRNVGLKSRFTRFFDFNDWELDDCCAYLRHRAAKQGYTLEADAELVLHEMFESLRMMPGFGNGRDVEYVWSCLLECQCERVFDHQEAAGGGGGEATSIDTRTVMASDAKEASAIVLKARAPAYVAPMAADPGGLAFLQNAYQQMAAQAMGIQPALLQQQQQSQPQLQQQQKPLQILEQEPERFVEETRQAQDVAQTDSTPGGSLPACTQVSFARDAGVSDSDWRMLEAAKDAYEELYKQMMDEQADRLTREEAARKLKEYQAQQERLRQLMNCPMGFSWFQCDSGWRCGGGGHFVSNAELEKNFTR